MISRGEDLTAWHIRMATTSVRNATTSQPAIIDSIATFQSLSVRTAGGVWQWPKRERRPGSDNSLTVER